MYLGPGYTLIFSSVVSSTLLRVYFLLTTGALTHTYTPTEDSVIESFVASPKWNVQ